MKIAVCLYGLVGGSSGRDGKGSKLNPRESFISYQKNIFKNHDIDFFIHCWDKKFEKEIIKIYAPKKYLFEERIDFSNISYKDYLIDHIDTYRAIFEGIKGNIGDKILTPLAQRTNSRWLSSKKSINLLKDYMEETKTNYSLVIQLRFDMYFENEILIDEKFLNVFSCVRREKDNDNAIDDLMFISTPKQAFEFSTLYDHIFEYSIRPPFAALQHLRQLGIEPKYFLNKKDFTLMRFKLENSFKSKIKRFIKSILKKITSLFF